MKSYNKYILKDMAYLLKKLFAIVLIVTLGVCFSLGLFTTAPNMRYSVAKYYEETNSADIIMQGYEPFSAEFLEEFKNNELIEDAMGYYSFDLDVEFENGTHLAKVYVLDFKNEININTLTYIEGEEPNPDADKIEIVIERKQPFLIDVDLGYETKFLDREVKVVGIVQNPWYFAFVEEMSYQEQRPIEIIIYADQGLLAEVIYTNIAATLKNANEYDPFTNKYEDFVDDSVERLESEYSDYFFTTRNLNQSFAKYKSDVKIVERVAIVFPLFFLLITVLVSMASITRIVADQRQQIGTLQSLGYGKFKIMGKYILYVLISSGLGVLLGIALGVYFIPRVAYDAYGTIYNLPDFSIRYYFGYTSIISFSMIISVLLVTIFSVGSVLKEKPTELLRVKTPKPGKKILLEKIPFIWRRLKFKYKSTFRNIFRHKRNLILTLIGISGSTALLLAGFGIKDSLELSGKYQFEEFMDYNIELNINEDTDVANLDDFNQIYLMASNAQYLNKDYISIIVPEDIVLVNDFLNFKDIDNNEFKMDSSSVIVTNGFAKKHDLQVNDEIELVIQGKQVVFKITHLLEYHFGNQIYIAKDLIEDMDISLKYNKIYLKTSINEDNIERIRTDLEENENVVKVMFEEDLKYSFKNTSKSMDSIILILIAASSALAVIINYNLTLINIHSRRREIATLKVLGYSEREVSGYVFRETTIISVIAIIFGLFLGKFLHYFIISQITVDGVLLNNLIAWQSYLYTAILSLVYIGIVYLISLPQTRKIDMVDALKSFE